MYNLFNYMCAHEDKKNRIKRKERKIYSQQASRERNSFF